MLKFSIFLKYLWGWKYLRKKVEKLLIIVEKAKCRRKASKSSKTIFVAQEPLFSSKKSAELECPEAWKTSRLKALYKNKGSKLDAAMHRALMINSTIYKVLMMIILDRLRLHYDASILPHQYGFRPNKSTTDGVFVARQAIKKVESEIW